MRFCLGHSIAAFSRSGKQNGNWQGGRSVSVDGYALVQCPEHPRAKGNNGYVFEHILIVEAALGHYLPSKAQVHHFDEDKSNNANGNLIACQDWAYHILLHRRKRAFDECGDANARRCGYCSRHDRQDDIVVSPRIDGGDRAYHRSCRAEYARKRNVRLESARAQ